MRRVLPAVVAALAASLVVLLVALSASSGPVELWGEFDPAPAETGDLSAVPARTDDQVVEQLPPDAAPEESRLFVVLANIIGVITLGFLVVLGVWLSRRLVAWFGERGAPGPLRRRGITAEAVDLPDTPPVVTLRPHLERTLRDGATPRDAIIACWLQLEEDAAATGLPRETWETSAEYSTRVVALGSVDAGPIEQLAALYREARFSAHAMGEAQRTEAAEALRRLRRALADTAGTPA